MLITRSARHDSTRDFEIVYEDRTFKVHRLVLCLHSRYFNRLCDSKFKESNEHKIVLHDDPMAAVEAMIEYFYTFEYSYNPAQALENPYTTSAYELHSQVFSIANKYDVPGLKDLALGCFEATCTRVCQEPSMEAEQILRAAVHVYGNAPPDDDRLRKLLVTCWTRAEWRFHRHASKGQFEEILGEVPEFAADLIVVATGIRMGEVGENKQEMGNDTLDAIFSSLLKRDSSTLVNAD